MVIREADELRVSAESVLKDFVGPERNHLEYVVLALMARIRELQNAARNLMDHSPEAPIAIITLARAQYESYLQLRYILIQPKPDEREKLARDLMKFAEYDHVESIGNDRDVYRAWLGDGEKEHFERRIQIHDDVKRNLSKAQKKQGRNATWNGLSIAETAKAVGVTGHSQWYGVMSKVAHSVPSMFHKSITIAQDGYVLGNVERGEKDAIEWLERMNRVLELAIGSVPTEK